MIKWIAKNIGVDAGMIIIADADYFEEKLKSRRYSFVDVDAGNYNLHWNIKDTWNGPLKGTERIEIPSGRLIISDPCYLIPDKDWQDWLDKTYYGKYVEGNAIIINSMGGDGTYDVEFSLKKLNKKEK